MKVEFGNHAAAPTQRQVSQEIVALHCNDYLFQQGAQQFLFVAIRGRRRRPHALEIRAESANALVVFGTQCSWTRLAFAFARDSGLLEFAPALFPKRSYTVCLPAVSTILWTVAPLSTLRL